MKAKNDKFWIRHDSLTDNSMKASKHRYSNDKCKGLGKKYEFDWNEVQREEKILKEKNYSFSRCMDCFPKTMTTIEQDDFDEKKHQEFLEVKLEDTYKFIKKRVSCEKEEWKAKNELRSCFESQVYSIFSEINMKYQFSKLAVKSRWDLLRVTRDQFVNFLRRYANMDQEIYEVLRQQIQVNLNRSPWVNKMKEEDGLNEKWLEDSIPDYNNYACSQLNSLISGLYASFGIISCNGRNHPFFCFCGFGGTQME